jgi:TP901-1 family phage major tail protein
MGAQKGKDMLIRLDAGSGFETVAGLRATRFALNAGAADATSADAPGRWRQLLAGAGVQSASVVGRGVFKDAASDAALRQTFFDGATPVFQLVVPDFGTIEGPFLVSGLEYAGEHDGEATYEISLDSAGALSWSAH